jgi:hypothetical protein
VGHIHETYNTWKNVCTTLPETICSILLYSARVSRWVTFMKPRGVRREFEIVASAAMADWIF